jgi:pimeloyl-ACP methyl ester carboxylesterase
VPHQELTDEFALLAENAQDADTDPAALPPVTRVATGTPAGSVSAIRWGVQPPQVVFLHGGGQNAHTWDTVVLGLGLPALAVDLPGHGHSAWRADRDYSPATNAATLDGALSSWAVADVPVVGMSLGGLTAIALAARHPGRAREVVVVDVTPSVLARVARMTAAQRGTTTLVGGPPVYDDLETMVEAAVAGAPSRPRAAVRRGVLHNARRLADGRWTWRYDRLTDGSDSFEPLWSDVAAIDVPVTLVRGGDSPFVGPEDLAEFSTRRPGLAVEVVDGAGHSVQSDRPRELAALLRRVLHAGDAP